MNKGNDFQRNNFNNNLYNRVNVDINNGEHSSNEVSFKNNESHLNDLIVRY